MATPKTPRKPAVKPNLDKPVDAPDGKPIQDGIQAITADADKVSPVETRAETVKAAAEPFTKAEKPIEDAVVLEEPKPTSEAKPTPAEKPAPADSVRPTPAPTIVKSGPGFVPLVLGGVVAAGLGFGLARFAVPDGWPMPDASQLQAQLTQQADEITALRAELQAMPKDDGASVVLQELGAVRDTATAALEAAEAARLASANMPNTAGGEVLVPRLEALEGRIAAIESRPAAGGAADPALLSSLSAEIDSLRTGLAAQKTAAEALLSEAEAVRADAVAKAQSVLLQAALTKIEASILDGTPFTEPLTMLVDAGLPVPAILSENAENGLPTQAALIDGFDEPARSALEQSLRGNMGSTWSDRVGSFLRSQTGARSLTPREGSDPDAILSRANAAVVAGDLKTALIEIATLSESAQTALADWVKQANLRIDAQAATVALATALSER